MSIEYNNVLKLRSNVLVLENDDKYPSDTMNKRIEIRSNPWLLGSHSHKIHFTTSKHTIWKGDTNE